MSLSSLFPSAKQPLRQHNLPVHVGFLLYAGVLQLGIFLATAVHNFYWGNKTILLQVHPSMKFVARHPHTGGFFELPVGSYMVGTQGNLLFRVSSLWDYFLFSTVHGLMVLDSLFIFSISVYLFWVMSRLRAEQGFSASISKAFTIIGLLAMGMFLLKSGFGMYVSHAFEIKTQNLFVLPIRTNSSIFYTVFGSILLICASFFRQGQLLQHENELTI
jgi:hypothetical protein